MRSKVRALHVYAPYAIGLTVVVKNMARQRKCSRDLLTQMVPIILSAKFSTHFHLGENPQSKSIREKYYLSFSCKFLFIDMKDNC